MKKNENTYYNTGTFAKMAHVSERTIRYYDSIGLLKPSFVAPNGYRKYTDRDFVKLQKIITLKQLGFSIEEIFPLVMNDNEDNLSESLNMQIGLLNKKINQLENLKGSLKNVVKSVQQDNFSWHKMIELTNLAAQNDFLVEQYKNATNLNARIHLHNQFSTNRIGWFPWLYSQIKFKDVNRLLEVGCGNGSLWDNNHIDFRNREIFLSDISEGMIDEVKSKYGNDYNCLTIDCVSIPFKDEYFEAVIANHVLFYLADIKKGLSEIARVLKPQGTFYCSTYGINHMKEITMLVQDYNPDIRLSKDNLYEQFGFENGESILKPYFTKVEKKLYEDALMITEAKPLVDYIMSCHGNQNELLGSKLADFQKFVESKIQENGYIKVTKEAGLFICIK